MSNPIFSSFKSHEQNQADSLSEVFNKVRNSNNPNQFMQQLLVNDPRFQNVVKYIDQNGGNAKAAFYNLAAQKGIDPELILNKLR